MASSLKCTLCGAVLKTANPIAPGKKVKCPKCTKVFVVEPEEEEVEEPEPETEEQDTAADDAADDEEEETPKSRKPAKAASKDDEEEEEEEDEKPKPRKPAKASEEGEEDEQDEEDAEGESPKKKSKGEDGDQKPKKKTGMIIGIILAVLLLCCCVPGGGATWFFWEVIARTLKFADDVQKDLKKLEEKGAKAPDQKNEDTKPAFTVTALAMTKEFIDDEKLATAKYVGRMVEVTGEVWVVNDKRSFTLKGAKKNAKDVVGVSIVCEAPPPEEVKVANLRKDGQAKVVGNVRSVAFGRVIQMVDCTLIK